ncbi:MAG: abortive infection system antitoxin AbiGi family protein [Bacteroidia bacterium]
MAISANTLFHFTENDKLKQILLNDFFPNYSLEDLSNATPPISIYKHTYIPMVCFCDLVFSQIKKHIDFYGNYGIGLRKKGWGIERGISPIYYVPEASISAIHIQSIAIEIGKKLKNRTEKAAIRKQLQNFYKYVKPYEGKAYNKKKKREVHQIFYNEREWRYVPSEFPVISKKRAKPNEVSDANEAMKKKERLGFSAQDIKYIIVRHEKEIPEFVDFIEKELKDKFSERDRKILLSKLISVNQIEDDV